MTNRNLLPCAVCGTPTAWRCADCAIGPLHPGHAQVDARRTVAVCARPECRDQHEQQTHALPQKTA